MSGTDVFEDDVRCAVLGCCGLSAALFQRALYLSSRELCRNVANGCTRMQVETLTCDMIAEGRLRGYIDQVRDIACIQSESSSFGKYRSSIRPRLHSFRSSMRQSLLQYEYAKRYKQESWSRGQPTGGQAVGYVMTVQQWFPYRENESEYSGVPYTRIGSNRGNPQSTNMQSTHSGVFSGSHVEILKAVPEALLCRWGTWCTSRTTRANWHSGTSRSWVCVTR